MPRTCLACASPERVAIDKAIVAGEPLRSIAKRVSISAAGLLRHKPHVAGAIVKAEERREERLGDSLLDEMRRVQRKAWQLLDKMESEGDHRGSVVALREVRECLESLGELMAKAGGSAEIHVVVEHIGGRIPPERKELPRMPIPADQQPCIEVLPVHEAIPEPAALEAKPVPAGVTLMNGQPTAQSNAAPLRASPLSVNDRPESFKNGFSLGERVGMSFGRRGRRGRW